MRETKSGEHHGSEVCVEPNDAKQQLTQIVFDLGVFVFEFWVLRFRDLGASCFGLRFRVLRFRNHLKTSPDQICYFNVSPLKSKLLSDHGSATYYDPLTKTKRNGIFLTMRQYSL